MTLNRGDGVILQLSGVILQLICISVCVCVCVCVHFTLLIIPLEKDRMEALSSACKTAKLILQIGCPSCHLTTWKKSALIQKPLEQTPKAFYQHENAEKTVIT